MPKLVQTVIDANGSIANVTNAEALIETPKTSVGIALAKIISNSAAKVKVKSSDRDTAIVRAVADITDTDSMDYQKKESKVG